MRNFFKRSERANRSRRPNRGVSAVAASLASVALVAGLASYPVEAQVSEAVSTTSSAVVSDAVTVDRSGNVDRITIRDTEDNPWDSGRKASDEYIWGVKRTGDGEITRIVSVVADGVELEPEFYGFVNGETFGVIGIDEDALSTLPPFELEIEVETTGPGVYSIAESNEVPTAAELSRTGYGINPNAAATVNPTGVGMARATSETKWSDEVQLSSPIIGTGKQDFPNIGTEPYFEVRPTGELANQVGPDIRITRIVVRNIEDNSREADNEATILKNDGVEKYYFKDATEVKDGRNRVKGFEARFFDPATGDSPVAEEFIIHSGKDSLKIGVDGVDGWDRKLDVLQSRYVVEVYGSFRVPVKPTTPAPTTSVATPTTGPTTPAGPSSTPAPTTDDQPAPETKPSTQGETTIGDHTFRVVAKTDPDNPMTLSGVNTTGANPYRTTATFDQRTRFSSAVVEVQAPNSIVATEQYNFYIDMLESGVRLERKTLSRSSDAVKFEVYPVKNGDRTAALVEQGATLSMTTRFSDNPEDIVALVTVAGEVAKEAETEEGWVPRPKEENWLAPRYANPPLPAKCGLKIAIVNDVSTSLKHATGVDDAFDESREAAKNLVDILAGTTTKIGVYSFSRTAQTQTPQGAISVQDDSGVEAVKNAIEGWAAPSAQDGGSTNWEAALELVKKGQYDAVYFITDGMPTYDQSGWQNVGGLKENKPLPYAGAFVQKTSLNRAIEAANELKQAGTRIVPLMVTLRLGGQPVTRDYVFDDLHNTRDYESGQYPDFRDGKYRIRLAPVADYSDYPGYLKAVYETDTEVIVNAERATQAQHKSKSKLHLMDVVTPGRVEHTEFPNDWSYGPREVVQMAVDISGENAPISVDNYGLLRQELEEIAQQLRANCEGFIEIKKRIVDEDGEVVVDGAADWEFTANAGRPVFKNSNAANSQAVAGVTNNDGRIRWQTDNMDTATVQIAETIKDPYRIYRWEDANAICTQENPDNGHYEFINVNNSGEDSFEIEVAPFAKVKCVVDNFQTNDQLVRLELEKLDATDNTTLSNAEFEVRSERKGDGPYLVTWDKASQTYKTEAKLGPAKTYYLVETKTPTKDGQRYSLLVAPVEFQIVSGENGYVVQVRDGEDWTSELVDAGLWTDRPEKYDAATGYLQVANVRQGNLPKTGGAGLQLPILFGGALIAAGALMGRRKVAA